jgi:hypothetical protein
MKKKVIWSIVGAVLVCVIIALIAMIAVLSEFPGNIKTPEYQATTSGVKSIFHQGVIYRYPGMVPMLEVTGDYYEMGLQYGVLLRPENLQAVAMWEKVIRHSANEMGIPYVALMAVAKYEAQGMSAKLPQRFQDEMRGVADGSGLPYETVVLCSLFYDVGESLGCTGALMRGPNGSIIYAHNNDTGAFWGEELSQLSVIVRHKPVGRNAVTHIDQPLYMGVETGYNDKGLCFGEETRSIRKPDPNGFSLPFLIRMVLEDSSTLDDIYPFFDKYHTIGAYGGVWADLRSRRGAIVELTPTAWAKTELKDSLLVDLNNLISPELVKQQRASTNLSGSTPWRYEVASVYPNKTEYTLEDAVNFLRASVGPDGEDYAWSGTRRPVCNWGASQTFIFDSNSEGFYLGTSHNGYTARRDIYHIHDDFSKAPELFMPAISFNPIVEKASLIENRLMDKEGKLAAYIDLANQYPDDPQAKFVVALRSFKLGKMEQFTTYAEKAYAMKPSFWEYRLFAGLAAYQKKDLDKAISLLEGVDPVKSELEVELYRLTTLKKAWANKDPQKVAVYDAQINAILDKTDAQKYYESTILLLLSKLDAK